MSTIFSFSAVPKVVASPEAKLRKEWEEVCKKVEEAITNMPKDVLEEVGAQAEWVCNWDLLMVSGAISSSLGRSHGRAANDIDKPQSKAKEVHEKATELDITLSSRVDMSEADKLHGVWTTRIATNSVSRQSSMRGTEEVEGVEDKEEDEVEDDGGDIAMAGIEPGTSASTVVKKGKKVAKVRGPLVAIALVLTCFR